MENQGNQIMEKPWKTVESRGNYSSDFQRAGVSPPKISSKAIQQKLSQRRTWKEIHRFLTFLISPISPAIADKSSVGFPRFFFWFFEFFKIFDVFKCVFKTNKSITKSNKSPNIYKTSNFRFDQTIDFRCLYSPQVVPGSNKNHKANKKT